MLGPLCHSPSSDWRKGDKMGKVGENFNMESSKVGKYNSRMKLTSDFRITLGESGFNTVRLAPRLKKKYVQS